MGSRVKVSNEIKFYERDNREETGELTVESHWNRRSMVVLRVGLNRYTVNGEDLLTAIKNAMNVGGW